MELKPHRWSYHPRRIQMGKDHVQTPGIDWGGLPKVIYTQGNYEIWRIKGHTGWSGIGMTSYYPTEYRIAKREGERVHLSQGHAFGKDWRKGLEALKERIKELQDGLHA